jgi:HD superfamily phosphodiesterase
MTRNDFQKIKDFFTLYTAKFWSLEPAFQKNIELKKAHSYRVWENSTDLAKSLKLKENDKFIIESAALLHDIGRFKQFEEYGTFSDKKSVNHAWLSTEVIKEENIISDISNEEQELILRTVYNHNKKEIPGELTEQEKNLTQILRDADKLDIWKVVTDYYCNKNEETNNTLQLDLPDNPEINPENYNDLMNERLVDINKLRTLNDFKLLQVGWIYDINFSRTIEILAKKRYLQIIFDSLPDNSMVNEIKEKINNYMDKKIKAASDI